MVLKNTFSLYLAVCTLLCVFITSETRSVGAKKGGCSEWQKTACQPKKGDCGPGFQQGTRTGECKGNTERRFKCTVPCAGESDVDVAPSLEALEEVVVAQPRRPAIRAGKGNEGKKNKRGKKGKKGAGKKGKRNGRKVCRYDRGTPTQCDAELKLVRQTLTLRKGDPHECEVNKNITRPCEGCKYGKSEATTRGECNMETNTQPVSLTLKSGDPEVCAQTWTVNRKCNKRNAEAKKKGNKKEKRQQKKQARQEKKKEKKQEKRQKKKDKKEKRKNKKECKYNKGTWTECDNNNEKRRVDTIMENSKEGCQPTKTLIKKCRVLDENKCRYGKREASECVDGKITITSNLLSGRDTCAPTKTTEKTCGKCVFDKWGDFGTCQNGVKTKKREVLQGGEKCQRRAVKMRKCKD